MSQYAYKALPHHTGELTVTIPWEDVVSMQRQVIRDIAQSTELPGFRKGKAPVEMVEKQLDPKKVTEEVIRKLVPKTYSEGLTAHHLAPISSPKISIQKAEEGKDWSFTARFALKPTVTLGDYKTKIRELTKKTQIWTPGKDPKKEEPKKPSLDELVKALLEVTTVDLPEIILEDEINRMLSALVDQTAKLGMTVEQYLMAKQTTSEAIRAQYRAQAEHNLKLEFALTALADQEKIAVSQKDIDDVLTKIKNPEEKDKLSKDTYYLAHIIRQQKTLDFLASL